MADAWLSRMSGWKAQPEDARSPFDVDYARIVHSGSFRRLQGKTQILNLGDSDFYRTRLTHSLEVAQIAGGVVRQIRKQHEDHPVLSCLPAESLVQALGFAHDLGHPPFGHGGEVALNYCMRSRGGFEGNGQTLRILSRLENFSKQHGSDLTRRSLLGVLKYPAKYSDVINSAIVPRLDDRATAIRIIDRDSSKPPKCYLDDEVYVVDHILAPLSSNDHESFCEVRRREGKHGITLHKSLDCSIMDLADDIAYGVHDLEDVIALSLVTESQFRKFVNEEDAGYFLSSLKAKYGDECGNDVFSHFATSLFSGSDTRKRFIGRLVHHFMTNLVIDTYEGFEEPLLKYRVRMDERARALLDALQDFVVKTVIWSAGVQHLEFKGQKMVVSVFEAFESEPTKFLPSDTIERWKESGENVRVICDHVAGMTDAFLLKTYDRLFSPRMGSVFDKL